MQNLNPTTNNTKKIKLDFKDSKYATGRRKRSIAKVWVKKGSGNISKQATRKPKNIRCRNWHR